VFFYFLLKAFAPVRIFSALNFGKLFLQENLIFWGFVDQCFAGKVFQQQPEPEPRDDIPLLLEGNKKF
jgi:hypothetical protein